MGEDIFVDTINGDASGDTLSGVADALDRTIYNSATGALICDANGTGAGGAALIAVLTSKPPLTADDFVVI